MTIQVKKSPTADTRTCDFSKVSKAVLLESSQEHIKDVRAGMAYFARLLEAAGVTHDQDKIHDIDQYHEDFVTGFTQTTWWDAHRRHNRHHMNYVDGVPTDVDLVDVFEYVVDCVVSGMARRGSVYEVALPDGVLQRALRNTMDRLMNSIEVVDDQTTEVGEAEGG